MFTARTKQKAEGWGEECGGGRGRRGRDGRRKRSRMNFKGNALAGVGKK